MTRLWILQDWYIEVDENGFYRGPLGEGVLGSVLRLQGDADGTSSAWKLPRLLADTVEENAYIEGLLAQELRVVIAVRDHPGKPAHKPAQTLLRCRDQENFGAFKGRRDLAGTVGDRAKQDGFALFVQFQKGLPPRLCLAKFGNDGLEVIPANVKGELQSLISRDIWDTLMGDEATPFNLPSFCSLTQSRQVVGVLEKTIVVGTLEGAIVGQDPLHAWYTGVSSIQWDWATMNLQEAIGEALLASWGIDHHFVLWTRVLDGIAALHQREYLHADLRPANIFCCGNGDDPENFFVGDYGSFSAGESATASNGMRGGNTLIGPEVGRGRSSPFYSMERRAGVERETADTAIISYDNVSDEHRIWLGWKSQVLDDRGLLQPEIAQELAALGSSRGAETAPVVSLDNLRPGDRIRLRDEVFKVKTVATAGRNSNSVLRSGLFCICEGQYSTVVHDRLTVRRNVKQPPEATLMPRIVPLSSFTELRQWSAATDLFSIGALTLYTLYSSGRQRGFLPNTVRPDPAQNIASPKGSQTLVAIDSEFRQLMMVLESVPYLRVLWPDLDYLWKTIVGRRAAAMRLDGALPRSNAFAELFNQLNMEPADDVSKNLPNVVSNITQSVPNIKVILQHFDWNMIRFVLFMHFVLRCLHRTEHLGVAKSDTPPFCVDRTDKPRRNGAASEASTTLEQVQELLRDDNFRDSMVINREVPDYDVRSEFSVKIENAKLEKDLDAEKDKRHAILEALQKARVGSKPGGFDTGNKRAQLYAVIDSLSKASDPPEVKPVSSKVDTKESK